MESFRDFGPATLAAAVTLRKVRRHKEADPGSVTLTLFQGHDKRVRGWYIGPLAIAADGITLPYLAPSKETIAAVAVVRALAAAQGARTSVCVVDPQDLWTSAWHA
jgi:hypothetical protein